MNHVSSPDEPFPAPNMLAQATTTHRQGNFEISSRKLPISKSGPIDDMSRRLGIPVPEMIFGDNLVAVRHAPSGWAVEFAAEPALDAVDKTGANMLQVAYAGEWSSSRERSSAHDIREVVKPYDWSYSTTYRGSETPSLHGPDPGRALAAATPPADDGAGKQIPLELLKRRDPILFFDEVVLFESELDDNGVSVLSCKLRVMEQRMLLLCRLYMRLDGVVVRVRDTRVYVDFEADEVIREYTAKEDSHANVTRALRMSGLHPDAVTAAFRDANQVAHLLPVVEQQIDSVTLSPMSWISVTPTVVITEPERLFTSEDGTEASMLARFETE
ncbi:putative type 2a phosphatase activator tip41 [Diaporthe ampelina]|uniref:Putative type 2a phosphatase activator tip41 n=1 Tax=Diaporthe ampelina TaxID=1214573 RepID=A0A0G2FI50_9PEZI|nr:putative type 2a phosphatase activator tip41 [Diaporthe ampelina]